MSRIDEIKRVLLATLAVVASASGCGCNSDSPADGGIDGAVVDSSSADSRGDGAAASDGAADGAGDSAPVDSRADGDTGVAVDSGSGGDAVSGVDGGDTVCSATWTDTTSGLTWQVAPSGGTMTWADAKAHCQNLSLCGHDDWRLPTISELRSLIRGCPKTEPGGTCGVTDSCLSSTTCKSIACAGCADLNCKRPAELSGACFNHWSSSELSDFNGFVWTVHFTYASVEFTIVEGNSLRARCVR